MTGLKDLTGRETIYKYDAAGRQGEVWDSEKLTANRQVLGMEMV